MCATPRIFVIDDNRAWLEAFSEYLRRKGFIVFAATSGAEALDWLAGNDVSLVVCDYHLPGMSGLELVHCLRRQRRDLAILMVSSLDEPGLIRRVVSEGARAFVAKTTSPKLLLRKLRQVLDAVAAESPSQRLHPWQRLLPSPQRIGRKSSNRRAS
jgi:CheY-like chemotaxis protein